MGAYQKYLEGMMKQNAGYIPTWLPVKKVSVGDYGTFTDNGFARSGNISQLGMKFQPTVPQSTAEFDYSSSKAVSTNVKLAGEVTPTGVNIAKAKAGVFVKFERAEEVRFRAIGCESTEIDNLNTVEQQILASYNSGAWPKNRVIVVESIMAKGTTVIISNGNKAQVDLSTDVKVTTGAVDLADVDLKFNVTTESQISTKVYAKGGLTPLFRIGSIVDKWGRPPQFKWKAAAAIQKRQFKLRKIDSYGSLIPLIQKKGRNPAP